MWGMARETTRLLYLARHAEPDGGGADEPPYPRMIVGPDDGPGEESFDIIVCTPEWLARAAGEGFYDPRHHVIVNLGAFDKDALRQWLARRVVSVEADTWTEIGERVARLGVRGVRGLQSLTQSTSHRQIRARG
jgi:hypothetical protein